MQKTVAVVMAIYNPDPRQFSEQLYSLMRQTRQINELIIVDDASYDAIAVTKALESVGFNNQGLCRVKILRSTVNAGHTRSFVLGLLETCCDYIFFCDQDDKWHPEKISKCVSFLADHPEILCATHDFYIGDENLFPLESQTAMEKYAASGVSPFLVGHGFATVIRNDIKDLVAQATPGRGGHDGWIRTIGNLLAVRAIISEPLVIWRRHPRSHTSIVSQKRKLGKHKVNRLSLRLRIRCLRREKADAIAIRDWILASRANGCYSFLGDAEKRVERLIILLEARSSVLMQGLCRVKVSLLIQNPALLFADVASIVIYRFRALLLDKYCPVGRSSGWTI